MTNDGKWVQTTASRVVYLRNLAKTGQLLSLPLICLHMYPTYHLYMYVLTNQTPMFDPIASIKLYWTNEEIQKADKSRHMQSVFAWPDIGALIPYASNNLITDILAIVNIVYTPIRFHREE